MDEKAKAARAAYAREYRKRNPEKIKAAQDRYWQKRAEKQPVVDEGGKHVNAID